MQSDEGQHKYIRHKELCVNGLDSLCAESMMLLSPQITQCICGHVYIYRYKK